MPAYSAKSYFHSQIKPFIEHLERNKGSIVSVVISTANGQSTVMSISEVPEEGLLEKWLQENTSPVTSIATLGGLDITSILTDNSQCL